MSGETVAESEQAPSAIAPPGRWHRMVDATFSRRSHLWPLLVIIVVILTVWARPVLGDFTHLRLSNPGDSESFAFSLAWNVHAVTTFQNPFFTPNLYAPSGLDLGNAITVPSVSLLVAPVTMLFGATAGFNTAFLLAIFLAAWFVYLLARTLFGSVIGAGIAGVMMVVAPYFTGHALGHLNLMWIFGLPMLAYLFVKTVTGRLRIGWFIGLTALVIAFTAGASTELVVTSAVFGALALVIAYCFALSPLRRRILRAAGWLAVGGVGGAILSLPVVLAALHSGIPSTPANTPALFPTELTNVIAPTRMVRFLDGPFAGLWKLWLGNDAENTAFLSIPLVLLLLALCFRIRGRLAIGILTFGAISFLASLGPFLTIAGVQTISLPWTIAAKIPGLDHALPGRFSAFVYMAVVLLLAYAWAKAPLPRAITVVAVVLAFVLMIPNLFAMAFPTRAYDPPFVTSGKLARTITPGDNVLVLPAGQWGPGMRWQTETGFDFTMPTGNGGGAIAPQALQDPVGRALWVQDKTFDYAQELPAWLNRNEVDLVIVPTSQPEWNDIIEGTLDHSVPETGGVWVYRPGAHGTW